MDLDLYLTLSEAAQRLPITKRHLRLLIDRGEVPGVERKGVTILIPLEWVESKEVPAGYIPVGEYAKKKNISGQAVRQQIAKKQLEAFKPFGRYWYVKI